MELGIAESAVTIRALSVNGKRMSKGIYSQLPRRPLLADDCTVEGRPRGHVVDPKCCHSPSHNPHWHVVHEYEGELFISFGTGEVVYSTVANSRVRALRQ
ncbi:hypothetical protein ACIG5E_14195 [Kitasatospora sp. NPDC053057]|uniref:hypothetical protein n=1 Tax=Kitasatospora sp. NPDC053057 TaxID=3364062 RepID=UPI0037CB2131